VATPLPPDRDNPGTTHEEPVYLFTDKAVSAGEGAMTAPPGPAREGHPLLAALLGQAPRIRHELPGWAAGHLVPALHAFPDDATGAQLAAALANLRKVLHGRADVDPWLGDVAKLGTGEYAEDPRADLGKPVRPARRAGGPPSEPHHRGAGPAARRRPDGHPAEGRRPPHPAPTQARRLMTLVHDPTAYEVHLFAIPSPRDGRTYHAACNFLSDAAATRPAKAPGRRRTAGPLTGRGRRCN
jgi:hypothetical protein